MAKKYMAIKEELQKLERRVAFLENEVAALKKIFTVRETIPDLDTAVACAKMIDDAFRSFLNPSMKQANDVSSRT